MKYSKGFQERERKRKENKTEKAEVENTKESRRIPEYDRHQFRRDQLDHQVPRNQRSAPTEIEHGEYGLSTCTDVC
jgi:hypothetical protein